MSKYLPSCHHLLISLLRLFIAKQTVSVNSAKAFWDAVGMKVVIPHRMIPLG